MEERDEAAKRDQAARRDETLKGDQPTRPDDAPTQDAPTQDEAYVSQQGETYSRRDDDRAREAAEQPLKKAAEPDPSGVGDAVGWFLKPLPIALIAVVVVIIFAVVIL